MRLSLDLGLGSIATLNAGVRYDSSALALFERFNAEPSSLRKRLINDLIVERKDIGTWSDDDAFYVIAMGLDDPGYVTANDAHAARQNWVANQYNLTAVASPVFTTDRDYQGDGSSSYLDTGFNPTTATSPKFTQNSAHMLFVSRTATAGSGVDMGNANSLILTYQTTTSNFAQRCNAGSSGVVVNPAADGSGRYFANRTGAGGGNTDGGGWRNASEIVSSPQVVSAAPDNSNLRILGRSGTVSYSARQVSVAGFGAGLSDGKIAADDAAILTYLQAVGAA